MFMTVLASLKIEVGRQELLSCLYKLNDTKIHETGLTKLGLMLKTLFNIVEA